MAVFQVRVTVTIATTAMTTSEQISTTSTTTTTTTTTTTAAAAAFTSCPLSDNTTCNPLWLVNWPAHLGPPSRLPLASAPRTHKTHRFLVAKKDVFAPNDACSADAWAFCAARRAQPCAATRHLLHRNVLSINVMNRYPHAAQLLQLAQEYTSFV